MPYTELEEALRGLEVVQSENSTLKEYLNLTEQYKTYKAVPAYVINKDVSNYSSIFVINAGSDNGIKENMTVTILSYKGNTFAVEPPTFVELEVTYTEPGFSGNTTTTSGKPAKLETGLEIQVPLFVNIGDILRIDTRTCEYMERV